MTSSSLPGSTSSTGDPGSQRCVVICNVYPDDNRGGAAITSATIAAATRAIPDAKVSLITTEPRETMLSETHRHTRRTHPGVEILPSSLALAGHRAAVLRALLRSVVLLVVARPGRSLGLRRVQGAEVVIGKGGQAFSPRSGWGTLAGLWLTLFPLVFAWRCGVPTALYGVTVGPYRRGQNRKTRWVVAWLLRRVDVIIVRDAESMRQVQEFGIPPERIHELADAVFGLEPPDRSLARSLLEKYDLNGRPFAALTVTTPAEGEAQRLFPALDEVFRVFLDEGTIERVVVAVQTDGPTTSDLDDSRRFVESFDDPRVFLVTEDLSAKELIALYGQAEFLLGCRLHSAIFGLVGGTISLPVSRQYMRKADDIYAFVGLERLVLPVERSPAEWVATIRAELMDAPTTREQIRVAVDGLREDAAIASRLIASLARSPST